MMEPYVLGIGCEIDYDEILHQAGKKLAESCADRFDVVVDYLAGKHTVDETGLLSQGGTDDIVDAIVSVGFHDIETLDGFTAAIENNQQSTQDLPIVIEGQMNYISYHGDGKFGVVLNR